MARSDKSEERIGSIDKDINEKEIIARLRTRRKFLHFKEKFDMYCIHSEYLFKKFLEKH